MAVNTKAAIEHSLIPGTTSGIGLIKNMTIADNLAQAGTNHLIIDNKIAREGLIVQRIGIGTQEIDLIPTIVLALIAALDALPLSDAVEQTHPDQVSSVTTAAVYSTGTVTALGYMSPVGFSGKPEVKSGRPLANSESTNLKNVSKNIRKNGCT